MGRSDGVSAISGVGPVLSRNNGNRHLASLQAPGRKPAAWPPWRRCRIFGFRLCRLAPEFGARRPAGDSHHAVGHEPDAGGLRYSQYRDGRQTTGLPVQALSPGRAEHTTTSGFLRAYSGGTRHSSSSPTRESRLDLPKPRCFSPSHGSAERRAGSFGGLF